MSLNIELLEESFERIKPRASDFVASFYENLFTSHPELKPLFAKVDMATQQKKLLNALVLVVENLRNPETLGVSDFSLNYLLSGGVKPSNKFWVKVSTLSGYYQHG